MGSCEAQCPLLTMVLGGRVVVEEPLRSLGYCFVQNEAEVDFMNWTGVNNLGKKLVVRRLLMERKGGVDCGLKKINHRGSWSSPCVEWKAHAAVGAAECVLLTWDKRVVEKIEVAIGVFSVFCLYPNGEVWFLWALNVVYGSNDNKLRVGLQ